VPWCHPRRSGRRSHARWFSGRARARAERDRAAARPLRGRRFPGIPGGDRRARMTPPCRPHAQPHPAAFPPHPRREGRGVGGGSPPPGISSGDVVRCVDCCCRGAFVGRGRDCRNVSPGISLHRCGQAEPSHGRPGSGYKTFCVVCDFFVRCMMRTCVRVHRMVVSRRPAVGAARRIGTRSRPSIVVRVGRRRSAGIPGAGNTTRITR
jgi:hypothetical protein